MKSLEEIKQNKRVIVHNAGVDGGAGWIQFTNRLVAGVIWSFGGGWDHVSVSFKDRCPTWDEMCQVKDIFFREDEVCVEYHPAKKDYVNIHPFCLHIWKPQVAEMPTPPKIFV